MAKRGKVSKRQRAGLGTKTGVVTPGKTGLPRPVAAPKPAAGSAPPAPVIPVAPPKVDPFLTPEDLMQLNDFTTTWSTNMANIDAQLAGLRTDTDYQKTQVADAAQHSSVETADQMAGRGLFRSSLKDAALYDIEAQRELQTKFLNDKLTQATLDAGTQKKILSTSKENFDKAMAQKQVENAQGVNNANNAAFADAKAAAEAAYADWQKKYGGQSAPSGQSAPQAPGAPKPLPVGSGTAQPSSTKPNVASGAGQLGKPRKVGKVVGSSGRLGSMRIGSASTSTGGLR